MPAEGDPVILGHPHGPSLRFALQAVEVKAGDVQLLRLACDFQQLQDAHAFPDAIGTDSTGLVREINLFKSLVPEAADHSCSVYYLVYTVKYHLRWCHRPSARGTNGDGFPPLRDEAVKGWGPAAD
jgi:hypothetical protein